MLQAGVGIFKKKSLLTRHVSRVPDDKSQTLAHYMDRWGY